MANRKGSGGGFAWVLIIAAIFGVYKLVFNTSAKKGSDTAQVAASGATESYALSASNESWPPLEEGVAPKIDMAAASAVNYYVVLDGSGSMQERQCSGDTNKIKAAVKALYQFVETVPAEANLGLAAFDTNGTSERVPLGTGNREAIRKALDKVRAEGGTPLRSSIELGYGKLLEQGRKQLGYGEYHLVVVTDGVPDPSSEDPTAAVQDILGKTPVVLHTIGFCLGEDHVLNQAGRSFYVAAQSPEQLQQGLGAVLAEAPAFDATTFKN